MNGWNFVTFGASWTLRVMVFTLTTFLHFLLSLVNLLFLEI